MQPQTQDQKIVSAIQAIGIAIRDAGPSGIPAGHLYAAVCGAMPLVVFDRIVGMFVSAGLVRRDGNHLLTWCGPTD